MWESFLLLLADNHNTDECTSGYDVNDGQQKEIDWYNDYREISLGLKINGSFWNNISTQHNNLYNIDPVVFLHLNEEKLNYTFNCNLLLNNLTKNI